MVPIFDEIRAERARQDAKWGGPEHDDHHSLADWQRFIINHTRRATEAPFAATARKQLIRVAALAIAAIEAIDRYDSRESLKQ